MSYSARVFKVFIASPSDVTKERAIIRNRIREWNSINSEKYNVVLMPIGWETHSSPEVGQSPQKILNKQILKDCDLLVGVFWTRFGTPTEDYESGTEEEIEEHIQLGKPAMLYFSNKAIQPDLVDQEQYDKVRVFKDKYKSKSIYHEYLSTDQFKRDFFKHLQLKINTNEDYFGVHVEELEMDMSSTNTLEVILDNLSDNDKLVLKEGAKDKIGYINFFRVSVGRVLEVNGKQLLDGGSPREVAQWEETFEKLENLELIRSTNDKKEIFKLTNKGYQIADIIPAT